MAGNNEEFKVLNELEEMNDFFINKKLRISEYYNKYFPYELIYKWLSYGNNSMFSKREIAYILQMDSNSEEFCVRHNNYLNVKDFMSNIKDLVPMRIDVGSIFDKEPSKNKNKLNENNKGIAIGREYIIDIDMTDYDNIRSCCSGKKICEKCWKFIECAYEVLDLILKNYFNFKNLIWVFSGRRGIHCWVCDIEAIQLDNFQRSKLSEFLDFSFGNEKSGQLIKNKVLQNKNSKIFKEVRKIIDKYFYEVVIDIQKYFDFEENILSTLNILENHLNLDPLDKKNILENIMNQDNKWNFLIDYIQRNFEENNLEELLDNFKFEITFGLLYPKIDSNVSAQTNHLLKCPFNIHHATGNLSYPLKEVIGFNVNSPITVLDILNGKKNLKEEIEYFEKFVEKCKIGPNFNISKILE